MGRCGPPSAQRAHARCLCFGGRCSLDAVGRCSLESVGRRLRRRPGARSAEVATQATLQLRSEVRAVIDSHVRADVALLAHVRMMRLGGVLAPREAMQAPPNRIILFRGRWHRLTPLASCRLQRWSRHFTGQRCLLATAVVGPGARTCPCARGLRALGAALASQGCGEAPLSTRLPQRGPHVETIRRALGAPWAPTPGRAYAALVAPRRAVPVAVAVRPPA